MQNRARGTLKFYLRNHVTKGTTLPAGDYTYVDGATEYVLTLDHEVCYFGAVDLQNPGADTHQLLECLASIENAGLIFPAGDHLIPATHQPGSTSFLYFTTPTAIGARLDKYNNVVCDIINTGPDTHLGRGYTGHVYTLLGSVKYRFDQTPGFKFEADGGKSIAKVGVCLPDKFSIEEGFEARLKSHDLVVPKSLLQLSTVFRLLQGKLFPDDDQVDANELLKLIQVNENATVLHELKMALTMNQLNFTSDEIDFNALRAVLDRTLPELKISKRDKKIATFLIAKTIDEYEENYQEKLQEYSKTTQQEFSLSSACHHLRARAPLFGTSLHRKPVACQLMRKMPGVDLRVLMNNESLANDQPNYRLLSFGEWLQITIGLFRKLKSQMYDNGIVHRDLKPENIMADERNNRWIINIVDTGLSRFAHTQDGRACGNIEYAAPETFNGRAVLASDVYSIGKVTVELLENTIDMAPDDIKQRLIKLLNLCMQHEISARPSLEKCINELNAIYFDYKKTCLMIPVDQHTSADKGFRLGVDVLGLLNMARKNSAFKTAVDTFKMVLNQVIDQLPDNAYAIHTFIDVLDVQCFHDITDKQSLKQKLGEVTTLIFTHYDAIKVMHEELQEIRHQANQTKDCPLITDPSKAIALDGHIQQLGEFLAKNKNCPLDLDIMNEQITHFHHKLIKTRCAKKYFEGFLPPKLEVKAVASFGM